jgi:hypothetical protein
MAFFEELSRYIYLAREGQPACLNVGWLDAEHSFDIEVPSKLVLDALFAHCGVAVGQTRGFHDCDLCDHPGGHSGHYYARRLGKEIWLGSAEIRVFSDDGVIYAVPNLIYHFVHTHHYKPPEEFVTALLRGCQPPTEEYFQRLRSAGLEWGQVSGVPTETKAFRAEKTGNTISRIDVPISVHLDED